MCSVDLSNMLCNVHVGYTCTRCVYYTPPTSVCASVTKQYNLSPTKWRCCSMARKVTVMASHWPCVMRHRLGGISTYRLSGLEKGDEWSTAIYLTYRPPSVCLSVCRVPRLNFRTKRPRKPKIFRMESRDQKVKGQR